MFSRLSKSRGILLSSRRSLSTSNNVATVRLYRILMRQLQALPAQEHFMLQPPLNPRDFGRARLMTSATSVPKSSPKELFKLFTKWNQAEGDDDDEILQWYQELAGEALEESDFHDDDLDNCLWTAHGVVLDAMRTAFRSESSLDTITRQRFAITAIQSLQDVESMLERSSVFAENGLRVVATSR